MDSQNRGPLDEAFAAGYKAASGGDIPAEYREDSDLAAAWWRGHGQGIRDHYDQKYLDRP